MTLTAWPGQWLILSGLMLMHAIFVYIVAIFGMLHAFMFRQCHYKYALIEPFYNVET